MSAPPPALGCRRVHKGARAPTLPRYIFDWFELRAARFRHVVICWMLAWLGHSFDPLEDCAWLVVGSLTNFTVTDFTMNGCLLLPASCPPQRSFWMRQFYSSSIIIWCTQRYSISNHMSQLFNRVESQVSERGTKVFGIPFDQRRCGSWDRLPYSVPQRDPPIQRLNYGGRHLLHRLSQSNFACRPEESESHCC
jgi:hypothetical protein